MPELAHMIPHYAVSGRGPHTLVLTHGLASSGETWAAQVPALAEKAQVITWDLRGHGRSAAPTGEYSIAALAHDLKVVLDNASVDRAVVLGHSAGGVIAMRFALDFPERTAGLVLVGTASTCNDRTAEFYESLARIAVERGIKPVRKRLGLKEDEGPEVDPVAFAKITRCMAALRDKPLTPELARITCPTLILVGEKDFLGAGGSVIISRNISGSRLEIVPGFGHGLFLEDPAGFNERITAFLEAI